MVILGEAACASAVDQTSPSFLTMGAGRSGELVDGELVDLGLDLGCIGEVIRCTGPSPRTISVGDLRATGDQPNLDAPSRTFDTSCAFASASVFSRRRRSAPSLSRARRSRSSRFASLNFLASRRDLASISRRRTGSTWGPGSEELVSSTISSGLTEDGPSWRGGWGSVPSDALNALSSASPKDASSVLHTALALPPALPALAVCAFPLAHAPAPYAPLHLPPRAALS
eukprot:scaffold47675_cov63-Phaeocystis_antarctica.AAC.4